MPNLLNLAEQHKKWRALLQRSVEMGWFQPTDYRLQCYQSVRIFEETFPDRMACGEMLNKLEQDIDAIRERVDQIINRIKERQFNWHEQ